MHKKLHKRHVKKESKEGIKKRTITINHLIISLIIILGLIVIFNQTWITYLGKELSTDSMKGIAKVKIKVIRDASCPNCFDLSLIIDLVKSKNVKIREEKIIEFDSGESRKLIDKYNIKKVPTVLVFGEIGNLSIANFERRGDALVFVKTLSPYVDAASGKVKGLVELTYIKKSGCDKCKELTSLISQFKQIGMKFDKETTLDDIQAKELIEKYDIKKLPTLIFSEESAEYDTIKEGWQALGTVESDGSRVMRTINPPYFDLESNDIKGLVKMTMLTDKACLDCYDVKLHKPILERFSIFIDEEASVDISSSEGKKIISRYDIKKAPTIILSDDAGAYTILKPVWKQVGTIEDDGAYLFRSVEVMKGKYRDLTTSEIKG